MDSGPQPPKKRVSSLRDKDRYGIFNPKGLPDVKAFTKNKRSVDISPIFSFYILTHV